MISLVFDTSVLVSANLVDEGLESWVVSLAFNLKIQLYVSEPILKEYERVLCYPSLRLESEEAARFLARLRRSSVLVTPSHTVSAAAGVAGG